MNETKKKLLRIYKLLFGHFGHRHWWPGDSPLEVCIGAILTQNTAWKNVEKAIKCLLKEDLLSLRKLNYISEPKLAAYIKSAGYYNVKARRLKNFISHVAKKHDFSLDSLFSSEIPLLRQELLGINGIGRETADCMILYAAEKPIFVVDAYTRRVLQRHGFVPEKIGYDELQEIFHKCFKPDAEFYNDFHAQFVAVGNKFCRKRPNCEDCPLKGVLTK